MGHTTSGAPLRDAPTEGMLIRWVRPYDRMASLFFLGREGAFRRRVVDAAELRAGQRVLDVGCGTGTQALAARDRVGEAGQVVGIDPSAAMVQLARDKAGGRTAVRFEVAAVEALPFEDGSFDAVVSTLVFHHLPAELQRAGLQEIRRVLAPGGVLTVVDFPGGGPPLHRLVGRFVHRHDHAVDDGAHSLHHVASLAEELGFVDVSVAPFRPRFLQRLRARV